MISTKRKMGEIKDKEIKKDIIQINKESRAIYIKENLYQEIIVCILNKIIKILKLITRSIKLRNCHLIKSMK